MSKDKASEHDAPRSVRVGRLDSSGAVREELGKLYRAARKKVGGSPTPGDATKLAFILQAIGQSLQAKEHEERLGRIEKRLGLKD